MRFKRKSAAKSPGREDGSSSGSRRKRSTIAGNETPSEAPLKDPASAGAPTMPTMQTPTPPQIKYAVPDHEGIAGASLVPQIVIGLSSQWGEATVAGGDHSGFPFRSDTVVDGWSTDSITVRGVTQRGHLHRYNGMPRQDDFSVHHTPEGRVIVAVADGVSQARRSHIGASKATQYAAKWLHSSLPESIWEIDWLQLFQNTAWALNETAQSVLGLNSPDPVVTEAEMATTLVCAVIEPVGHGGLRACVAGVGDSSAWLLSAGCFSKLLSGKSTGADGIRTSEVVGLPRVPAEIESIEVEIGTGDVLLIGTDGIGDPLGTGEGAVGDLFRSTLDRPSPPTLIEFAHTVDFSRQSFDDDRTLVAIWPR
jgi:serine/threonine protein phosphatase PrpC